MVRSVGLAPFVVVALDKATAFFCWGAVIILFVGALAISADRQNSLPVLTAVVVFMLVGLILAGVLRWIESTKVEAAVPEAGDEPPAACAR